MEHVVMIIAPHPDDAEIAMGGTIASLSEQGAKVIVLDLTDGEPTPHGSREIRMREASEAQKILGFSERVLLDLKNREVFDTVANRKLLAERIRDYRPDIIFGPYWEDTHPDHIETCKLVEAARFYSKFVKTEMPGTPHFPRKLFHYYSTHIRVKIAPSFVYDISNFIDRKMDSIKAYKSQFIDHEGNKKRLDEIQIEAAYWGQQVQCGYGEPFICKENIKISAADALLAL